MANQNQEQDQPLQDASKHPGAGSGLRDESKSFGLDQTGADRDRKLEGAKGGGGDGPDPAAAGQSGEGLRQAVSEEAEIAADDAGASAMAEAAGKRIPEQPQ